MSRTISALLDVQELDLATPDEKEFNALHVQKLKEYVNGKCDGIMIKQLTAGGAVIARRQQSRSAVAKLKWDMMQYENRRNKGNLPAIDQDKEPSQIEGGEQKQLEEKTA